MENFRKFITGKRALTAIIFIALILVACYIGGWLWAGLLMLLIFIGADELIKLFNTKGVYPAKEMIYIFNFVFVVLAVMNLESYLLYAVILALILIFIRLLFRKQKVSINDITATVFATLYTALLPVFFILIRNISVNPSDNYFKYIEPGVGYLFAIFMVIWTSDIAAYIIGKNFGKNKLIPSISPNKTIEGAVAATVLGIIMCMVVSPVTGMSLLEAAILGTLIVILAQLGDLCESLIKRDVGVKDSGDIVPGHGGILDRSDSYVFSAPVAYLFIKYVILTGIL